VNLGGLQRAIETGKLDPKSTIGRDALKAAGLVNRIGAGIKLLAKGELKQPLTIEVDRASKSAIAAVEKAGGKVVVAAAPAA
ncbi:MAG: uL15m family ribosomal protein, partial [Dongiaceae bacterium]